MLDQRQVAAVRRASAFRSLIAMLLLMVQALGLSLAPTFMGMGLAHALGGEPEFFICGPGTTRTDPDGPGHEPGDMQRMCPLCQPASFATAPAQPNFALTLPIVWTVPAPPLREAEPAPAAPRSTAPPPPSRAPPSV